MKKKEVKEVNETTFKTFVIEETKYKTNLTKKFESRKEWKSPDPSMVTSIIPGTVSKLFVKKDDQIIEGEKLLILDAMKMKNTITVPYSGIVKKINVEEGQTIPKGFVMLEIDIKLPDKSEK